MALQDPEPIFTVRDFNLDGPWLTIRTTDTEVAVRPREEIEENEIGKRRWYKMEPLASDASKYWREQIANELVHKFLFMDPGRKSGPIHIPSHGELLTLCRAYPLCINKLSSWVLSVYPRASHWCGVR
jgi:hypothetical protein